MTPGQRVAIRDLDNGRRHEAMRLLPGPVDRHDPGEARTAHPGLIDGAVFAFVQRRTWTPCG
jgi:hypothetical protein